MECGAKSMTGNRAFSEREEAFQRQNLQGYLLPTVARHFTPFLEVNQRF